MSELALDLAGVFVFAVSGAMLGVRKGFDAVGIVVLALATSLGGGMLRDVLIGDIPPAALEEQRYLLVAVGAGVFVLVGHGLVERLARPVLLFDAAGLALFSVVGAAKAMEFGLAPVPAALLGTITAVGGGVIRDVLARDIPVIFRPGTALTAVPAAVGAGATVVVWEADVYGTAAAAGVAAVAFALRVLAVQFGWGAPVARGKGRTAD